MAILILTACAPKQKPTSQAPAGTQLISDTLFIVHEKTKDYYATVYIDQNKSSADRKHLLDFKLDTEELGELKEDYDIIKQKFHTPLKKYNLSNLPREWLPLFLYKGKHYIYYPSDYGNTGRTTLADTMMINRGFEILQAPLLSVHQINDSKYHVTWAARETGKQNQQITIYIIDQQKQIAVWEDLSQPVEYRYGLYVSKEGANNFDMIVSRCEQNKLPEYQFDKIDYATLIKGK
jgi:hypothetical protein